MGEGEVETNHTNGCEANGGPDSGDDRKKSAADLIIAPIQVIIPPGYTDDESEDEVEREQREKRKKKKKKTKKTVDKTMILTRTFAEAIRLINETKEREKQKLRQEQIRKLALEQKAKREACGRGSQVIIHTSYSQL